MDRLIGHHHHHHDDDDDLDDPDKHHTEPLLAMPFSTTFDDVHGHDFVDEDDDGNRSDDDHDDGDENGATESSGHTRGLRPEQQPQPHGLPAMHGVSTHFYPSEMHSMGANLGTHFGQSQPGNDFPPAARRTAHNSLLIMNSILDTIFFFAGL